MNVLYARVSTQHQNVEQQIAEMKKYYEIDKVFEEKASGTNTDGRPVLKDMLDFVREGDTVLVYDFSRLARSTKNLLDIAEYLKDKGVKLISHKEKFDTSTPTGTLMLTMLSAIHQFQVELMKEKQAIGIERARSEGKYTGRKKIEIPDDVWEIEYEKYSHREINKGQMCENLGITRPTLEKMLKARMEKYAEGLAENKRE